MKEETVEMDGEVIAVYRGSLRVALSNRAAVMATISGRMFKNRIRVLAGDKAGRNDAV
jgi:translation initiation factor IF-1